jgi:hypothetical protein
VKRLIASLVLLGLSTPSVAARMALDPLNRAHFGASVVDLNDVGISMGLDSRMTRLVYIDVGGFASAPSSSSTELPDSEDIAAYINTRHGIWVAPGFRVPHRYGDGLKWDVFLRGGFGVLWSQDLSDSESYLTNPAGLGVSICSCARTASARASLGRCLPTGRFPRRRPSRPGR